MRYYARYYAISAGLNHRILPDPLMQHVQSICSELGKICLEVLRTKCTELPLYCPDEHC